MLLLAIDTCFAACSVALHDGVRVTASRFREMGKGHAEALPVLVGECLAEAGVSFPALTRIVVTRGPGTFTGLRIGLAYAHGLATALDIPCVGLNSLAASAAGRSGMVVHKAGATGLFYVGNDDPRLASPDEVAQIKNVIHDLPDAARFVHLGWDLVPDGLPQPLYLREPDAKPAAPFEPIHIRAAEAKDLESMANLHAMCFNAGWSAAQFRDTLSLPGAFALIAEVNGRPRAFLQGQAVAGEAEIHTICTEPRQRRRGLARRLLMEWLRRADITRFHMEVAEDNAAARALYIALGFAEVGRRKGYYERGDKRVDAVLLARNA